MSLLPPQSLLVDVARWNKKKRRTKAMTNKILRSVCWYSERQTFSHFMLPSGKFPVHFRSRSGLPGGIRLRVRGNKINECFCIDTNAADEDVTRLECFSARSWPNLILIFLVRWNSTRKSHKSLPHELHKSKHLMSPLKSPLLSGHARRIFGHNQANSARNELLIMAISRPRPLRAALINFMLSIAIKIAFIALTGSSREHNFLATSVCANVDETQTCHTKLCSTSNFGWRIFRL